MRRLLFLLLLAVQVSAAPAETPLVAVASNMTHVMKEISGSYRQKNGLEVRLTFGSSGNFTRQIQQGAPYDIFLSAAGKYVDILAGEDMLAEKPRVFARGRIGFFIPDDSSLSEASDLDGVFNLLYHGNYRRIAIANPEHAPYGFAAEQSLQSGGLWAIERKQLLIAENAAQVAQYVLSGSVDAGIIPESFSRLPMVANNGDFIPIPETWHNPITQYLALLKGAGSNSRDFFNYLTSEEALAVVKESGYTISNGD